jgi:hypothetical protein
MVLPWRHEPARTVRQQLPGAQVMSDLAFIGLSVAFFAIAVGYAYFCDKVR